MGQKGFWDEQERREKLHQKKPMLKWLNEHTVFSEILGYGRVVHTPMEGIRVVPCNQQKDCN